MSKYILDEDGRPTPEPDIYEWSKWFESADRHVARDRLGATFVSTVFLGIDHRFGGEGDPILWETMVFGAPDGEERQRRYASREEALEGHAETLADVRAMLDTFSKVENLAPPRPEAP